jgi:hypothetical protein
MAGISCGAAKQPYFPSAADGRPHEMERVMSNYSNDNEVFGANALTGAVIAGALFLLVAVLAETSPRPAAHAPAAQANHVVASTQVTHTRS